MTIKNRNISHCADLVHLILKKLLEQDCNKNDFGLDISDDNLTLYINTLRKNLCNITKPNQYSPKYKLKDGVPFIIFDKQELLFLSDIKKTLSDKGEYRDIYCFNKILYSFKKFMPKKSFDELLKIINTYPIRLKEHDTIEKIEKAIERKDILEITYFSPYSGNNKYEVLPVYMTIENDKAYMWCIFLNSEKDIRYLRIDRIYKTKKIKTNKKINASPTKVLCEIKTDDLPFIDDSFKVIVSNKHISLIEFDFVSEFHFIQKISLLNVNCKIIRPKAIATKYKQILEDIINEYTKEV